MKNRLLKTFTSLVLVALMVISVMPAFAITIGAAEGDTYELVTDASTLAVGDKIIIVAEGANYAMNNTAGGNNRGGVAVTKNSNDTITNIGDNVQVITLGEGTTTGTFAFITGDGYLYAASSKSNYLKTKTTLDANGSWTITIADNVTTIKANGTNNRNLLRYNPNNGNPLFSCYGSGQQDISIYKLKGNAEETTTEGSSGTDTPETPACEHTNTEAIDEEAKKATCTEDGITAGVKCSDCGKIIEEQTTIPATGHTYENGVCTECDAKIPTYVKVTTDPTDWSGEYLIVYEAGNVAFNGSLTTLDAVSNTVEVTILDNKIAGDYSKNTFTIEKSGDNYIIKSASGYYIGNTSNSNALSSSNSTAYTNSISLDGNVNIISSGGAYLRYNATSGQTRFRYYKSSSYTSQKAITLYKLADSESTTPETEPTIKSFGVSLNKGVTINVTYDIPDTWLTANAGAKVVFSNGTEVVITEAGENVYSVTLTPAKINNDLTVKLVKEDGTVVIEEKDVSFAKYKELIGTGDEKLTALLNSIKTYADAADGTLQGELENTVESVEGSVTSTGALFNAYGAALKEQASIKLSVDTAKIAGDYRLTVTLGSKTVVENELLADYITAGNLIVINGLFPSNFDETINVTVSDGTTDVATLSFTFNKYLKDVYGTANSELKNLIVAAYNYGVAAEAYAGN